MMRWLLNLFRRKPRTRTGGVRILIPPELRRKYGPSKDYGKYRETYRHTELTPFVNGRKVRFWKLIYHADDWEGDELVPIFYPKRKRK